MSKGQRRAAKIKRRKERSQFRHRTIHTNGRKIAGLPFMGESMTCIMCGKVGQSHPKLKTDWRMIKADDVPYYVCTDHFPPDTAPAGEFEAAYAAVLNRIMQIREEAAAAFLLEGQLLRGPLEYVQPHNTPLYWRDEKTVLPAAMMAYINHSAEPDKQPALTAVQLALVICYCRYYINAPCWDRNHFDLEVANLRRIAAKMTTLKELDYWMRLCLVIGLDPL